MKKIISIILILTMIVAMSLPTFALSSGTKPEYSDESKDGPYDALVEYGASNGYELDIPPLISFTDDDMYVTASVGACDVVLSTGWVLVLDVASKQPNDKGVWELRVPYNSENLANGTAKNEAVQYSVALTENGPALMNGDTVLVVRSLADENGSSAVYQELHCNTDGSNQAGTYEDSLTFTARIVEATTLPKEES